MIFSHSIEFILVLLSISSHIYGFSPCSRCGHLLRRTLLFYAEDATADLFEEKRKRHENILKGIGRGGGIKKLDRQYIQERIEQIDRSKLSKADATNYGICSLLAQENLYLGNLAEAEIKAKEAMVAYKHWTPVSPFNFNTKFTVHCLLRTPLWSIWKGWTMYIRLTLRVFSEKFNSHKEITRFYENQCPHSFVYLFWPLLFLYRKPASTSTTLLVPTKDMNVPAPDQRVLC